MENAQNASVSSWDLSHVTSLDQNDQLRSIQDIMVRRMKNRERQRRYRARKRLEADRKKTHDPQPQPNAEGETTKAITSMPLPNETKHVVSRRKQEDTIDHFTTTQIEIPVNDMPVDFVTRIHSKRDWKRDARRVHIIKEQEVSGSSLLVPLTTPASESQAQSFQSGTKDPSSGNGCQLSSPVPDNNQERTVMPSRRHWKEEARNKKS